LTETTAELKHALERANQADALLQLEREQLASLEREAELQQMQMHAHEEQVQVR
jgi:hypothetical protein